MRRLYSATIFLLLSSPPLLETVSLGPNLVHTLLHLTTVLLSGLLLALSLFAFARDRRSKFLFLSGAFLLFFLNELISFSGAVLSFPLDSMIPLVHAELSHFLNFLTLALFSLGALGK